MQKKINHLFNLVREPGVEFPVLLNYFIRHLKSGIQLVNHKLTAEGRVLPDFLIIGVPRAGTTSLYYYLTAHPNIYPALKKEIEYFCNKYDKSLSWYKQHFPSKLFYNYQSGYLNRRIITCEATPNYFYHPMANKRIYKLLPNVKLIILLRNPVDRLWSCYWQRVRIKGLKMTFEATVDDDLKQNHDLYEINGSSFNEKLQNMYPMPFISRGIYREKLKSYFDAFPREQLLILRSEDLRSDPGYVLNQVVEFLDLPKWNFIDFKKYNFHKDQPLMKRATRDKLLEFYRPFNQLLYNYLGRDFGWDE